ncbi:hypothetical protein LXL04_004923 [Taraxacum kok-saghyz]
MVPLLVFARTKWVKSKTVVRFKCICRNEWKIPYLVETYINNKSYEKLNFVEEPVEIMDREIKRLKQSRIPIVKVAVSPVDIGFPVATSTIERCFSAMKLGEIGFEKSDHGSQPRSQGRTRFVLSAITEKHTKPIGGRFVLCGCFSSDSRFSDGFSFTRASLSITGGCFSNDSRFTGGCFTRASLSFIVHGSQPSTTPCSILQSPLFRECEGQFRLQRSVIHMVALKERKKEKFQRGAS